MTKVKTSITVDPVKMAEVQRLTGVGTTSAAIDIALTELIAACRVRSDVEAYNRMPPTTGEDSAADAVPDWSDLADDTDWEAAYSVEYR